MLEAMNSRIPVLVNGRSRVMKEHCRLSGAALWYDNEREFLRHLHRLLTDEAFRTELGSRARPTSGSITPGSASSPHCGI